MKAVLYVGHGSRIKEGNRQLVSFIQKAMEHIDCDIQEICFIELAKPTILEGIEVCVQRGASEIAIIPILLLSAGHAKTDIPEEIEKGKLKYPEVQFSYGHPFGIEHAILTVLVERMQEQGFNGTNLASREDVTVLLVGRGSSDPDANSDLTKVGRLLWEKAPVKYVETCYLAATEPTFEDGIKRTMELPPTQVFILPYLLFTGMLMKKMKKTIDLYQSNNEDKEFLLCNYLGYHPKLVEVLIQRVRVLLEKS